MVRRIEGILFDLGDTLLDFGEIDAPRLFKAGGKLAYEYLRGLNQPLPRFRRYVLRQLWAIQWRHMLSRITGREFNSLELMSRLSRRFGQRLTAEQAIELAWLWYEPLRRRATVEEGLPEMLRELREAKLTLGIVSNTFVPAQVLDRHLEQEGLLELLPVRVYSCQVGYRKPHREIFCAALRQAGLDPAATLFVGDSPRADIQGAGRMGMVTVLKDPTGRHDGHGVRPDYRIRSVLHLPQVLAEHNAGA
ncbi:MAG TPA: HAD family hydrolase [Phycisphaerae bacterium]|nr:HAD family hydrolase [Phycisphaerae bacterium]